MDPRQAAREAAELRLRPIMMTMPVATLGLLPAAMSHDIGSDSQRPFAIVIVGGLLVELIVSLVLMPTLYLFWARPGDKLPLPEWRLPVPRLRGLHLGNRRKRIASRLRILLSH